MKENGDVLDKLHNYIVVVHLLKNWFVYVNVTSWIYPPCLLTFTSLFWDSHRESKWRILFTQYENCRQQFICFLFFVLVMFRFVLVFWLGFFLRYTTLSRIWFLFYRPTTNFSLLLWLASWDQRLFGVCYSL